MWLFTKKFGKNNKQITHVSERAAVKRAKRVIKNFHEKLVEAKHRAVESKEMKKRKSKKSHKSAIKYRLRNYQK